MRKLGVALVVAAAAAAFASPAGAADPLAPGPCEQVSEMFETANVQMPPTPEPTGTVVRAVCKRTG